MTLQLKGKSWRGHFRKHTIAGILTCGHVMHPWYKLIVGKPLDGWPEYSLILLVNILPSFYLIVGGVMLLPHIPKKADIIYIRIFVAMIFFCIYTTMELSILSINLVIIKAENNLWMRHLVTMLGIIGELVTALMFILNMVPLFNMFMARQSRKGGDLNSASIRSESANEKITKRTLKWFFSGLWLESIGVVDDHSTDKIVIFMQGFNCFIAFSLFGNLKYKGNPPDGSSLIWAIQESNHLVLSMATCTLAIVNSTVMTMMFDGTLVLMGRKSTLDVQYEMCAALALFAFACQVVLYHDIIPKEDFWMHIGVLAGPLEHDFCGISCYTQASTRVLSEA